MLCWDVVSHSGWTRRGITAEELHAQVREQQREQERQKAIEAEARPVVEQVSEKGGQEAPTQEVRRPPGLSVRKDSSPIKVRPCLRAFYCILLMKACLSRHSLCLEYSTQSVCCRIPTPRNKSLPYGQLFMPHGRAGLAAVLSARPFLERHMT